jgi:hypothetical protein
MAMKQVICTRCGKPVKFDEWRLIEDVTVKDAVTISQLRESVRNAWADQTAMSQLDVILLCKTPEKVKVIFRNVTRPAGTKEEYALIARDMREGYHAAAFAMVRPDLQATGYRVLPPYNERSVGLHSFLKRLWQIQHQSEYTQQDS